MKEHRKSRTGLKNVPRRSDRLTLRDLPFAQLVRNHPDLIEARRHYADQSPSKRRAAAEWQYHQALVAGVLSSALGQVAHEDPSKPRLDAGVLALTIDPLYAPALLTARFRDTTCNG